MLGGILNAITGSASAAKQAKMVQEQKDKNQRWYDRRYNEVGTERADAQASLTAMRNAIKEQGEVARGVQAVAGGSEESAATQKQAATNVIGNVVSGINVNAEKRKDGIEAQYQARDAELTNQQIQAEEAKRAAMAQAGSALDSTIGSAISAFNPLDRLFPKTPKS